MTKLIALTLIIASNAWGHDITLSRGDPKDPHYPDGHYHFGNYTFEGSNRLNGIQHSHITTNWTDYGLFKMSETGTWNERIAFHCTDDIYEIGLTSDGRVVWREKK